MRRWFDFKQDDILLAVTTISSDIAAIDVWLPLVTGARSVIMNREAASDGHASCTQFHRPGRPSCKPRHHLASPTEAGWCGSAHEDTGGDAWGCPSNWFP
jgi:hypothetical protein